MQTYLVGGAVRDALLGINGSDRDWVVVGSTPEEMLAQGFVPVGKDFPVFLHPHNKDEYALARTERKTAPGYKGFVIHAAPEVTLEQDLARRDLTINAIAQDAQGQLTDPYGGERDLKEGVLRHVSLAFREDPVRILRLARFAARFPHFAVAPETQALMVEMVQDAEVKALVAAALCHDLGKGNTHPSALPRHIGHEGRSVKLLRAVCERLRVPQHCKELAEVVAREHGHIHGCLRLSAESVLRLLVRCDALRRPERFSQVLQACECDARGRLGLQERAYPQAAHLRGLLNAALSVDTTTLSDQAMQRGLKGAHIGQHIDAARVLALKAAIAS